MEDFPGEKLYCSHATASEFRLRKRCYHSQHCHVNTFVPSIQMHKLNLKQFAPNRMSISA